MIHDRTGSAAFDAAQCPGRAPPAYDGLRSNAASAPARADSTARESTTPDCRITALFERLLVWATRNSH